MSHAPTWTDDRVAVLTKLWRDGLSASVIARELGGISRNAVLGKVHRLGLTARATWAPGKARRPPATKARLRRRHAPTRRPWPAITEPAPVDGLADVVSVGRRDCRWPIGDPLAPGFSLCGRPAVRGAYCAAHGALAYRPRRADRLLRLAGLR